MIKGNDEDFAATEGTERRSLEPVAPFSISDWSGGYKYGKREVKGSPLGSGPAKGFHIWMWHPDGGQGFVTVLPLFNGELREPAWISKELVKNEGVACAGRRDGRPR